MKKYWINIRDYLLIALGCVDPGCQFAHILCPSESGFGRCERNCAVDQLLYGLAHRFDGVDRQYAALCTWLAFPWRTPLCDADCVCNCSLFFVY